VSATQSHVRAGERLFKGSHAPTDGGHGDTCDFSVMSAQAGGAGHGRQLGSKSSTTPSWASVRCAQPSRVSIGPFRSVGAIRPFDGGEKRFVARDDRGPALAAVARVRKRCAQIRARRFQFAQSADLSAAWPL